MMMIEFDPMTHSRVALYFFTTMILSAILLDDQSNEILIEEQFQRGLAWPCNKNEREKNVF